MTKLLLLKDASTEYGIPIRTLRRAVDRSELAAYRLTPAPTCPIRLRRADIEGWLETTCRRQRAAQPGGLR